MKCPHCQKELRRVNVLSQYWGKAKVDKTGHVVPYGNVGAIVDIIHVECAECFGNVTKVVNYQGKEKSK